MNYEKIFPFGLEHREKKCRLYCFHHAGGSVCTFKKWLDFSEIVEVVPLELPDRSCDVSDLHFNDVINDSVNAIRNVCDNRPFFIYGHSLGSLFAFQTAWRLKNNYNLHVQKLFVAGRHAPQEESSSSYRYSDGMEALCDELMKDGGIEQSLLKDKTFQKIFLPMIYNDYRLNEEYVYNYELLNIPIIAMNGSLDSDATLQIMSKWKNVTRSEFRQYEFYGNHFFPYREDEHKVLEVMESEIKLSLAEGEIQ